MGRRERRVARSIVFAILNNKDDGKPPKKPSLLARALRLLNLYWLTFELLRRDLFSSLRSAWGIPETEYKASFVARGSKKKKDALEPLGDMGYSGSTFFRTSDARYLVKSVPRGFENSFFKKELIVPYAEHMQHNPGSILVRITDFLQSRHKSIGMFFGLAPSHHIVMDNLLCGSSGGDEGSVPNTKWESWDLKPTSYFFPERDVAGGALASEATKSRLPDEFDDKIYLTVAQRDEFLAQLRRDTKLLADANAVDYSLFLVRVTNEQDQDAQVPSVTTQQEHDGKPSWRTGITSPDSKQTYRAAVLDFFWSKHSMHAKAMTGLIKTYNVIDERGPMSITAESSEYRDRFVKMCEEMIEVQGE
ncbi:phosphatidylinositol-4-phosphate 5-kinase-domain-containing protein [Microdochium trichocladiopsis]|uniref:Phosphatidylinositol-4-phosphate 5-kinase-domain-containing protein n=1 Tax=Microdochium trichocladiopsis TaxID=1682393 RepID=A0A9P8Y6F6_9PEZI|nr:phosphatidylinositol-4-phosphate 5-kinase-domain-containing protein [Microdochium trichocladiopsis]KAH7029263.1 phosphatidylinositol-4-phosphate 5-kinase-domain-containing protein [Microdochium trichocladiopsis]